MTTDDEVLQAFERADPAREPETALEIVSSADYLAELRQRSTIVTLNGPNETAGETAAPPTRLLQWVGAAAAAVLVVGGVALLLPDGEAADDTIAMDGSRAGADIDAAERFIDAFNDRDVGALETLSTDGATFSSAATAEPLAADELESALAWYDAFGWRWDDARCVAADEATVACDLTEQNRLTDLTDANRPAVVTFTMDDGAIATARIVANLSDYSANAFVPFRNWVRANHPGDPALMWNGGGQPLFTDESTTLFDRNLDEYERVWVANQFIEAMNNRDQSAVETLSASGTMFDSVLTVDPLAVDELTSVFAWYDAFGWRWDDARCVPADEATVTCDLFERNRLTDLTDAERPAVVTFELADGKVTAVVIDANITTYARVAFGPFQDWVQLNHPRDVTRMWDGDRPVLTAEAAALFDQRLTAFSTETAATTDE